MWAKYFLVPSTPLTSRENMDQQFQFPSDQGSSTDATGGETDQENMPPPSTSHRGRRKSGDLPRRTKLMPDVPKNARQIKVILMNILK